MVCSALTNTADDVLGKARSYQPVWFQESMEELKPLLHQTNDAYKKWLATRRMADLKEAKNVVQ